MLPPSTFLLFLGCLVRPATPPTLLSRNRCQQFMVGTWIAPVVAYSRNVFSCHTCRSCPLLEGGPRYSEHGEGTLQRWEGHGLPTAAPLLPGGPQGFILGLHLM